MVFALLGEYLERYERCANDEYVFASIHTDRDYMLVLKIMGKSKILGKFGEHNRVHCNNLKVIDIIDYWSVGEKEKISHPKYGDIEVDDIICDFISVSKSYEAVYNDNIYISVPSESLLTAAFGGYYSPGSINMLFELKCNVPVDSGSLIIKHWNDQGELSAILKMKDKKLDGLQKMGMDSKEFSLRAVNNKICGYVYYVSNIGSDKDKYIIQGVIRDDKFTGYIEKIIYKDVSWGDSIKKRRSYKDDKLV